jgi:hypothetical protein
MRHCRPVRRVALVLAWVAGCQLPVPAQSAFPSGVPNAEGCLPMPAAHDNQHSLPATSIVDLVFSDFLQVPTSDQTRIAASIKQHSYRGTLDEVKTEAMERIREEWQNRGYINAKVSGDERVLTSSPVSKQIALTVSVDEGAQYRLREITFKNNRAIVNEAVLRNQFPIKDGDIFMRQAIGKGLENLRYAYGQLGYINFTAVPSTAFDESDGTISLDVDVDEGRQFYVSSIDILGADARVLEGLALRRGQVYNVRLIELFLREYLPEADVHDPTLQRRWLDEKMGTVALTFDFRHCPAE